MKPGGFSVMKWNVWIATHVAPRTPMLTLTFKKNKNKTCKFALTGTNSKLHLMLVNFVHWTWSSYVTDTLLWPSVSLIFAVNDTGCLAVWAERRICGLSFWGEKSAKPRKRLWIKVLACVFVCVWRYGCVQFSVTPGIYSKGGQAYIKLMR